MYTLFHFGPTTDFVLAVLCLLLVIFRNMKKLVLVQTFHNIVRSS
jgi:hypothetical protein